MRYRSKHSPELIERARRLWKQGFSAREIATKLGLSGPNAVIGIAGRNNFGEHPEFTRRRRTRIPQTNGNVSAERAVSRTCQWIEGEPKRAETVHCGKPTQQNSSFCEAHHKRCYFTPKSPSMDS